MRGRFPYPVLLQIESSIEEEIYRTIAVRVGQPDAARGNPVNPMLLAAILEFSLLILDVNA